MSKTELRRRARLAGTLVLALLAWPAGAQTPDLSGKWTVVAPAAAAGAAMGSAPPTLSAHGNMSSGWGSPITLTQSPTSLTVEYTYFHPRENQPSFRLAYALDGARSRNTVNIGRGPQLQVSRAVWQGGSLVITTEHEFVNPQNGERQTTETRQMLTLEAPDTLVIETFRAGVLGGKPSTTRTTFKR